MKANDNCDCVSLALGNYIFGCGFHCFETFSLVAKITFVLVSYILAGYPPLAFHQEIKSAFLHRNLEKSIYREQPLNLLVFPLKKSLYELKIFSQSLADII